MRRSGRSRMTPRVGGRRDLLLPALGVPHGGGLAPGPAASVFLVGQHAPDLLVVPSECSCSPPLGYALAGQFLGDPGDGAALDKPGEDLAHPTGLLLADTQALLGFGPTPFQLLRPVRVEVIRIVAVGEVAGAAVVQHAPFLPPPDQVAEIADGGAVLHLHRFDAQFPSFLERVDALAGGDEPAACKNEVLDECAGVVRPCQAGLVVDGQDGHLAPSDHRQQFLVAVSAALGARLGLVADDQGALCGHAEPGQVASDIALLVVAAVRALHVRRVARVDDDRLHDSPLGAARSANERAVATGWWASIRRRGGREAPCDRGPAPPTAAPHPLRSHRLPGRLPTPTATR